MKRYKILLLVITLALAVSSCQKMYRPPLKEIIPDPTPPPYNALKSFWAFENNLDDQGENAFTTTSSNVTYVAGIKGQAVKFGENGYVLVKAEGDTVKYPNEWIGIPKDTIANLGSFTISFWMNVPGPVTDGAQGIFSISHKNQFWGNLDIFLENWDNAQDPSEAWIKVHMLNASTGGLGEQWVADDLMKIPGVLNKWTHIVITYDAATSAISVYKDGAPTATHNKVLDGGNYRKLSYNDFNGIVLGTHQFQTNPSLTNHGPEPWAKSLNGALDQFRVYNRALSDAEITALFNAKD